MKKSFYLKIGMSCFFAVLVVTGAFFFINKAEALDSSLPGKLKYKRLMDTSSFYAYSAVQNGILMPRNYPTGSGDWYFDPQVQLTQFDVWCAVYRSSQGYVDCPINSGADKSVIAGFGYLKTQLGGTVTTPFGISTPRDTDVVTRFMAAAYITWNKNETISWIVQVNLKLVTPTGPRCDQKLDQTELHYKDPNGVDLLTFTAKNVFSNNTFQCAKVNSATPDLKLQDVMGKILGTSYRLYVYKPGVVQQEVGRFENSFNDIYGWDNVVISEGIDPSKIVLFGNLNFATPDGKGTNCSPSDLKQLGGAEVVVYDSYDSSVLGRTTVSIDSFGIPKYWLYIKKGQGGYYLIKASKSDFYDGKAYVPTSSSMQVDISLKVKKVSMQGTVLDETSRKGVSGIFIFSLIPDSDFWDHNATTSKRGRYETNFFLGEFEGSVSLKLHDPKDQYASLMPNVSLSCPTNNVDFAVIKEVKDCQRFTGKTVDICWMGENAISLKNDPQYQNTWLELADLDQELRTKMNSSSVGNQVIVLGYNQSAAYADRASKNIYLYSGIIVDSTQYLRLKTYLFPHEFGHGIDFSQAQISPAFETLLKEGNNLIDSHVTDYTKTSVYKILSPGWGYYVSDYGLSDEAFGYAGTNGLELFAETFATMYRFDQKMHEAIAGQQPNPPMPADLRVYAKKVHNAAAGFFPHGNTIAVYDLFNKLAAFR